MGQGGKTSRVLQPSACAWTPGLPRVSHSGRLGSAILDRFGRECFVVVAVVTGLVNVINTNYIVIII